MRRRDVPFIAPAQSRHQIGAVASHHRHAHRNAVWFGNRHQIGVHFGNVVCRNPRAKEIQPRAARQPFIITRHAFANCRDPDFAFRRRSHDGKDRQAIGDQSHRHAPTAAAAHIIAGAINGIDKPQQPRIET